MSSYTLKSAEILTIFLKFPTPKLNKHCHIMNLDTSRIPWLLLTITPQKNIFAVMTFDNGNGDEKYLSIEDYRISWEERCIYLKFIYFRYIETVVKFKSSPLSPLLLFNSYGILLFFSIRPNLRLSFYFL